MHCIEGFELKPPFHNCTNMSNNKGRRCSADGHVNAVKPPFRGSISSLSSFRFFGSSECINAIKRRIHLLDDRFITMEFTTKTLGGELLREVCSYLNAAESAAYFGIRYVDNNSLPQWLDPERRVMKQIKDLKEDVLSLRVMFYPPNPLKKFKKPDAKHLFYLQLRRDFYVGRLRTNCSATCELAAYAIQADHELTSIPAGFDVVNIPGGMCILPDIPTEVVDLIRYRLKRLLGLSKEQAKDEFIRRACEIETYGMEPFQVMDQYENGLCIGFNHLGISAFKNGTRTDTFYWRDIKQVKRSGKQLVIVIPRRQRDVSLGFKCHSSAESAMLWRRAVCCRQFSRCVDKANEDTEKDEVDEQPTQTNDHSEETPEPTVAIHYELELQTDSSQSSTEDFHKPRANEKDFSQASLSRFLPAPRHSLALPPPLPFAISQRQKQFGGSMELSAYPNDLHPHVVDDFSLELSQHKPFFTSSSINLSNNHTRDRALPRSSLATVP
ncbi:hypothetical protein CRM22_002922 [Opisthorchis felineus]|uniref:FERM domain-containing protein n=1 Tax=Opisthorchis felineus TaxID=147828 RepID=A0A4S2M3M6_OPIFE|nr:hypothetical protein CRM22_002922 [Opisthorchis felineus]